MDTIIQDLQFVQNKLVDLDNVFKNSTSYNESILDYYTNRTIQVKKRDRSSR